MTWGRQIRQLLRRLIRQELIGMHWAFPAIVVEYLGAHPDPYGATNTPGVLKGRAMVQPKIKLYKHDDKIEEMPIIFDVPVSWYQMGGFLYRFPMKPGDVVMCTVSERALDHVLADRKPQHPQIKRICRLDDAVVLPFGLRTDADAMTPDEYTDSLYIAATSANPGIVSKFIMKPDGEVLFECAKFTVISPDVNLVDYDGPQIGRIGDKAPCKIEEGSPCARCATASRYAPTPWAQDGTCGATPLDTEMPASCTGAGSGCPMPQGGKGDKPGESLVESATRIAQEQGLAPDVDPEELFDELEKQTRKELGEHWEAGKKGLLGLIDKDEDESWGQWALGKIAGLFS